MSKLIALIALLAASGFLTVGNFWFTYGIYPRSWPSFFLFWIASTATFFLLQSVSKEGRD